MSKFRVRRLINGCLRLSPLPVFIMRVMKKHFISLFLILLCQYTFETRISHNSRQSRVIKFCEFFSRHPKFYSKIVGGYLRRVCSTSKNNQLESNNSRSLGSFVTKHHDVGGEAFEKSENSILIKEFTYDGQGEDTVFVAGTYGQPSLSNGFELRIYRNGQVLDFTKIRFDGSEDLTLSLPPGKQVTNLRWIAVWCKNFDLNFGHIDI